MVLLFLSQLLAFPRFSCYVYNMPKLNQRQERFCHNYARCGVVWLSAALSGYRGGKASLGTQGYRLLRRPEVQGRVAELAAPVLIGVIRMAAIARGEAEA